MLFVFRKILQKKCNVKTSRLLFSKRNRMLSKLPPASQKSRREFEALFANNFQPFANGFYLLANKLKSYANNFR
jgi:hypothetical protein